MQIGNRIFRPGIIPTLVTILILPVLIRLGFWQLERAEEKRILIAQFQEQQKTGPLEVKDFLEPDKKLNYRNVKVQGNYQTDYQVLIDNKVYQNQAGYYSVTPLKIKNSTYSILVNRGWIPMGKNRADLPIITTTTDLIKLDGKIKLIEKKPFKLGNGFQSNNGWPAVVQWLNIADIEQKTGLKLLPYILLLNQGHDSGFVRNWKPVVMQPEKSTSYAVQWFSLALALIIIYIVVNLKKIERKQNDK